uniref:Uncharacterized protein n=1 Tax=Pseudo-nitzschia australis TaxID=44445 RepID=A0A6U9ZSJ0_9STRA|mmetsp:Transcript_11006/g.23337  ORF Transcript_11006/g.23337 Transcript_11006/m.23337 type:complete len:112 (+) Transcript_11006:219-554(+)
MYDEVNKHEAKMSAFFLHAEEIYKVHNYIEICESALSKLKGKKQKLEEQNKLKPHSVKEIDFVTIDKRIKTEKKLIKSYIKLRSIQQIELEKMIDEQERELIQHQNDDNDT